MTGINERQLVFFVNNFDIVICICHKKIVSLQKILQYAHILVHHTYH